MSIVEPLLPVFEAPVLKPGPVFLCFEIQGKPPHKGRHRSRLVIPNAWQQPRDPRGQRFMFESDVKKIFVHNYADPETAKFEAMIGEYAKLMMRTKRPSLAPIALLVHAFRAVPESWSHKDKKSALMGGILPTPRPDGDNYLKIAQDALNGIVWKDDSQVCDTRAIKRYSDRPGLRIEVREFLIEGLST